MTEDEGRLILVDKALEWTSFDVVKKLRNILGIRKIGHAGTLDPLATGLLIVCAGKMTKQINRFMEMDKEYMGTMIIGQTTPSYDLETAVDHIQPIDHITERMIQDVAGALTGTLMQVPPKYSAVRIKGKRAYNLARKGVEVKLAARKVVVKELDITGIDLPEVHFRLRCSKGFYVRSFVRDFGEKLGVGAHMVQLRRTGIGHYRVSDAIKVDEIKSQTGA
jgi:tRNA pseudouridine55 synthase